MEPTNQPILTDAQLQEIYIDVIEKKKFDENWAQKHKIEPRNLQMQFTRYVNRNHKARQLTDDEFKKLVAVYDYSKQRFDLLCLKQLKWSDDISLSRAAYLTKTGIKSSKDLRAKIEAEAENLVEQAEKLVQQAKNIPPEDLDAQLKRQQQILKDHTPKV